MQSKQTFGLGWRRPEMILKKLQNYHSTRRNLTVKSFIKWYKIIQTILALCSTFVMLLYVTVTNAYFILVNNILDFSWKFLKIFVNFQKVWIFDFYSSFTERYHELYSPEFETNVDLPNETSSVNVMWVGIGIAAVVFLNLALVAALYIWVKKHVRPSTVHPHSDDSTDTTFTRIQENYAIQNDPLNVAPVSQTVDVRQVSSMSA